MRQIVGIKLCSKPIIALNIWLEQNRELGEE